MVVIEVPRIFCISERAKVNRFLFSKSTSPVIFALGTGNKRKMLIAVTLLPHPDSPTNAKNSPGFIEKDTRSVTANGFLSPKETDKSRTDKTQSFIAVSRFGIHRISHPFAYKSGQEQSKK